MMTKLRIAALGLLSLSSLMLGACGNPVQAPASNPEQSATVAPPFSMRGELDGLLLVWFDQAGTHTATRRSDVPEAHRREVRIDSLHVAPDKRLDPDQVYVADLSAPGKDGSYPVRKTSRSWFDSRVVAARPPPEPAASSSDVTIYMASWCGACRSAAAYLRSRHVPFAERDIEKDSEANGEMLRKARAAGKSPSGVPVIDFHGHIILGFDRDELARLIEST